MNAKQLAAKLVLWIREKVLAAGCKGVVVGMSGGLDSSVLAVLCYRAFPKSMLGMVMPCHSNPEDEKHASRVCAVGYLLQESRYLNLQCRLQSRE